MNIPKKPQAAIQSSLSIKVKQKIVFQMFAHDQ